MSKAIHLIVWVLLLLAVALLTVYITFIAHGHIFTKLELPQHSTVHVLPYSPVEFSYTASIKVNGQYGKRVLYRYEIDLVLGYDKDNEAVDNQVTSRKMILQDTLRTFFSTRSKEEMLNEVVLKQQLLEMLNQSFFDKTKVSDALFLVFDKS
jgi:flagellar basal body-associated protein FliL